MKYALLIATGIAFGYVIYLGWWVSAASVDLIALYIGASIAAWITSLVEKRWASRIKWVWVAVSLSVMAAIVLGPLKYLQLS